MEELATLASSGATTLVGLMVTDSWVHIRTRMAALFRRHGPAEVQRVDAELEQSRADLITATEAQDQQTQDDMQAEWRSRLRRLLASDPQAVTELQEILDEFSTPKGSPGPAIQNLISGGTFNGPTLNSGTQINHL
ncbi:hypothetical protein FSY75_34235 [Streptomyces sp. TR1341]|uniref:hypothetical protein n=1 Tax=Streptomyces sp. TR1341 TaxID=2601266 RepID=UPI00138AEE3D|nr:hypothetical protein [Streptomyces sp. TR1341]